MANFDIVRSSWNTPETVESWRIECETDLPAYTASGEFDSEREERGGPATCCAFERLDAITQTTSSRKQLGQSPQLRLVSWVMLCRITDESLPLSERFSCPMANCSEVFPAGQHMQLVNHISGCPHLPAGQYRCPYPEHMRIESFMEPSRSQQTRRPSKRGFFRQTIGKICGLGSRSLKIRPSHGQQPHRPMAFPPIEPQTFATSSMKRPFPNDSPTPVPELPADGRAELDSFPDGGWNYLNFTEKFPVSPAPNEWSTRAEAELPTSIVDTFPEMDVPQVPERSELPDKRMSSSSVQSTSVGSLTPAEQSPISPLTPQSIFSTEGFDHPLSPTDIDNYSRKRIKHISQVTRAVSNAGVQQHSPVTMHAVSSSSSIASGVSKRIRQVPQIRVDTSFNTTPSAEDVSPFSVSSESATSEALNLPPEVPQTLDNDDHSSRQLVQELRGLFNCLFKLSMRKLCQDTVTAAGLNLLSLRPSAALLFTSGLQALQKIVKNEVPQDFLEIFGLSILPYACGIAGMDANLQDQFHAIYLDQMGWSQAIEDPRLRGTYLELIWELWATSDFQMSRGQPGLQQVAVNNQDGLNQQWTLDTTVPFPEPDFDVDNFMMTSAMDENLSFSSSPFSVHDTAIKQCLNFLDAFEYPQVNLQDTNILSHNTPSFLDYIVQPGPGYSSVVMDHVLHPLTTDLSLGTFRPVIDLTCFLVAETHNITLRNTELSLLEEGKAQGSERGLYKAFASEVRRLSDNAATIMGCTGYRSVYYDNDITKLFAIHNELMAIERHTRGRRIRSRSSSLGSGKGKHSSLPSPTSSGYSESSSSTPYRSQAFTFSNSSSPIDAAIFHSRNNSNEDVFAGRGPDFSTSSPAGHSSPSRRTNPSAWRRPSVPSYAAEYSSGDRVAPAASSAQTGRVSSFMPAVPTSAAPPAAPPDKKPPPDAKVKRQCPHCSQVFEQQAQYIKANITRHIREKHRDNAKKLSCTEPGCSYTSTRKGNLTHHQRAVHGLT